MAATKKVEEMEADIMEQPIEEKKPVKAAKKEVDPWEQKVTIMIPKATDGSSNGFFASCNGRRYLIKRGVKVDVPAPIAEVIEHMFEAEAEVEAFIDKYAN